MRVLTVRQPWAGAIIHREKDVENRFRNIAGTYRGPVAIHVALRHDYDAVAAHNAICGSLDQHSVYGYGAIIGVVDLCGVHESGRDGCGTRQGTARLGELIPLCSEWAEPWAHHLVIANPRALAEPIPFKGALGLRTLPDDVEAAITDQLRLIADTHKEQQ